MDNRLDFANDGYMDDYEIAKREVAREKGRNGRNGKASAVGAVANRPFAGQTVHNSRGAAFGGRALKYWKIWSGAAIALFGVGLALVMAQGVRADGTTIHWQGLNTFYTDDGSGHATSTSYDFSTAPLTGAGNVVKIYNDSAGSLAIPDDVTVTVVGGETGGKVVSSLASNNPVINLGNRATVNWEADYESELGESVLKLGNNYNSTYATFVLGDSGRIAYTGENTSSVALNVSYANIRVETEGGSLESTAYALEGNVSTPAAIKSGNTKIAGTVRANLTIAEGATLTVEDGETLTIANALTNSGTIAVDGTLRFTAATPSLGGTVAIGANGRLAPVSGELTNTGTITNNGTIDLTSGSLANSGALANNGAIIVAGTNRRLTTASALAGTVTLGRGGSLAVTEAAEDGAITIAAQEDDNAVFTAWTVTGAPGSGFWAEGFTATSDPATFNLTGTAVTVAPDYAALHGIAFAVNEPGAVAASPVWAVTVDGDPLDDLAEAKARETGAVALTAPAAESGYRFTGFTVKQTGGSGTVAVSGLDAAARTASFTMPAYNVTVTAEYAMEYALGKGAMQNGDVTLPSTAIAGEAVTVTAVPEEGYRLLEEGAWTVTYNDGGEDIDVAPLETTATDKTSFTMPAGDVTVAAAFEQIPAGFYAVTVANGITGGEVTRSHATAEEGTTITVTATPSAGYSFGAWSATPNVTFDSTSATATFEMPAEAVEISATFTLIPYTIAAPEAYDESGTTKITVAGLTLTASTTNGGSSADTATIGTTIYLSATGYDDTEWQFAGWEVTAAAAGVSNPTVTNAASASFPMPASNITIKAKFRDITVPAPTLTVSVEGATNNAITAYSVGGSDMLGNIGSPVATVAGASVSITADTAVAGYKFTGWTGAPTGATTTPGTNTSTLTFDMPETGDFSVKAVYKKISAITLSGAEHGSVSFYLRTGTGWTYDSESPITEAAEGDWIIVVPEANAGYTYGALSAWAPPQGVTEWAANGATNTLIRFQMPAAPVAVTASFSGVSKALTVGMNIGGVGSIVAPASTPTTALVGSSVTLTAEILKDGYRFAGWTAVPAVDFGEAGAGAISTTFTMPNSDVAITANFEAIGVSSHALTINAGSGGAVTATVNGSPFASGGNVPAGAKVVLTAVPDEGKLFGSWSSDDIEIAEGDAGKYGLSFDMPDEAVAISATFADQEQGTTYYDVTVETDGNGSAYADPARAAGNTEIHLYASPNQGYKLTNFAFHSKHDGEPWNEGITGNQISGSARFDLKADTTVVATFELVSHHIFRLTSANTENLSGYNSFTDVPNPTASAALYDPITFGTTVTLTAADPEGTGYTFDKFRVVENDSEVPINPTANPLVWTFAMPEGNVAVYADYTPIVFHANVAASPTNGGTFARYINSTPSPALSDAKVNDAVEITVSPNTGFEFASFQVAPAGFENYTANGSTITFTMPPYDVTVTAKFEQPGAQKHRIDVSFGVGGTANAYDSNPLDNPNAAIITEAAEGTPVWLAATPHEGYGFLTWTGDVLEIPDPYDSENTWSLTANYEPVSDFVMPNYDVTAEARFKAKLHLTVDSGTGGAASLAIKGQDVTSFPGYVVAGESVTVTASPADGYTFKAWTVKGDPLLETALKALVPPFDFSSPSNAFNMPNVSSPTTFTATFTPRNYTLTMAAGAGGAATSPAVGQSDQAYGSTVNISATPSASYKFSHWTASPAVAFADDGAAKSSTSFTMPMGNVAVTANFEALAAGSNAIIIDPNVTGGSITAPSSAEAGTLVTLTAVPNNRYSLDAGSWSATGSVTVTPVAGTNTATFTMPDSAVTVSVAFLPPVSRTVYLGTITPSGSGTASLTIDGVPVTTEAPAYVGDVVTLAAIPFEGYEFANWVLVNAAGAAISPSNTSPDATFVVPEGSSAIQVRPTFRTPPQLTVAADENGAASLTAFGGPVTDFPATIPTGTVVSVNAVPTTAGYVFEKWTVSANVAISNFDEYEPSNTFAMPPETFTLTATFMPETTGKTVTVTSSSTAQGTATADYTTNVPPGRTVTVTANPIGNYEFASWNVTSGGVELSSANESPATFTMGDADVAITATFRAKPRLTLTSGSNGSVSLKVAGEPVATPTGVYVATDASVQIEARADEGYYLKRWLMQSPTSPSATVTTIMEYMTGSGFADDNPSTGFRMPPYYNTNGITLYAEFDLLPDGEHIITIVPPANGTVTSNVGKAASGATITLTVTPDEGYALDTLTVNNGDVEYDADTSSFTMPDAPVTVAATFKQVIVTPPEIATAVLNFGVTGGNGALAAADKGGALTSPANVEVGDSVTLTATPIAGYRLSTVAGTNGWTISGVAPAAITYDGNTASFAMPEAPVSASVAFEAIAFPVSVSVAAGGGGTAAALIAGSEVTEARTDSIVTLKATLASDDYRFVSWDVEPSVDLTPGSTESTVSFVMPAGQVTATARFEMKPQPKLEVTSGGNGRVTASVGGVEIDDFPATIPTDTLVTVEAEADYGYTFTGWSAGSGDMLNTLGVNGLTQLKSTSFRMPYSTDVITLTASFGAVPSKVSLAYVPPGTGSVQATADGSPLAEEGTALYGQEIVLTARPETGYTLKKWEVTVGGDPVDPLATNGNTATFTMPLGDVSATAYFIADEGTLVLTATNGTAAANGTGTGLTNPGTYLFRKGTAVNLSAKADPGFAFKEWDAEIDITDNSFVMPGDSGPVTVNVAAVFEPVPEGSFAINIGEAVGGTADSDKYYAQTGETATITAYPDTGYELDTWSLEGDGAVLSNQLGNEVTLTMGGADVTVTPSFKRSVYTIATASAPASASGAVITVTPANGPYQYGDQIALAASEVANHTFAYWTVSGVDNADISGRNSRTGAAFSMPNEDVTVTAHYTPVTNDVTALYGTGGAAASADPASQVAPGTLVTLSATAASGYVFTNWTTSSLGVTLSDPEDPNATFAMPANGVIVTANFEAVPSFAFNYGVTGGNGTLAATYNGSPIPSGASIPQGGSVTLTAMPNEGFEVDDWDAGGVSYSEDSDTAITVTMPESSVTVWVSFAPVPLPSPSPTPSTSPDPSPTPSGSPDPSPTPSGSPDPSPSPSTGPDPSPSPSAVPEYVTVSVTTDGNGTATVDGAATSTQPAFSNFALRATANSGYTFDRWVIVSGGGNYTSLDSPTNRSASLRGVTGNVTVQATFKKSSSGGGGGGGGGTGGGGGGGSQPAPEPEPEEPPLDPAVAAAADALGLAAIDDWSQATVVSNNGLPSNSVIVKPLSQPVLLGQFRDEATILLVNGLNTLTKDARGRDYIRVYGAFDVQAGGTAKDSVVVSFKADSLTFGNKIIALVRHKDGSTSYQPVAVDFPNGKIKVRLPGNAAHVVLIEFRLVRTRGVGTLKLTNSQQKRVFDATYYAEQNPDVVRVFGTKKADLYRHFIRYGLREGRAGNELYDPTFYRLAHADLEEAYGRDTKQYVLHYLKNGRKEGRVAGVAKK
ncbi:MAG: hypothetical protein LBI54_05645 [Lachnospiraceae bacterium]|jgi:uncharacterized repeat protein (TIGR02543 family)|nr:hypothetical protein [Lachnospiraceae bacterium]